MTNAADDRIWANHTSSSAPSLSTPPSSSSSSSSPFTPSSSSSTSPSPSIASPLPGSSAHVWRTVGILGGGQLGRMLAEAARLLGTPTIILDPQLNSPAGQIADRQLLGPFSSPTHILQLASQCDILTMEIEHVDTDALDTVERTTSTPVRPSPSTVRLIQDKYMQKLHLQQAGIALGPFMPVSSASDCLEAGRQYGYPFMLKSRRGAYDGRGNAVVHREEDIPLALAALGQAQVEGDALYAEAWVAFEQELAVMVARGVDGQCKAYPCVSTTQLDNICHTVHAPARIAAHLASAAQALAVSAVSSLSGAGVYGVEMFLTSSSSPTATPALLLNEIAPRPHNSGHYTIEGCHTSQFLQHLRCVLGLPLGSTEMAVGAAVMVNVLGVGGEGGGGGGSGGGGGEGGGDVEMSWLPCKAALLVEGAHVHWYGKEGVRKGRKLGHITFVGRDQAEVDGRVGEWERTLQDMRKDLTSHHSTTQSIPPPPSTTPPHPPHPIPSPLISSPSIPAPPTPSPTPLIGVIMGSDSDLKTMRSAADTLRSFSVPFELTIVSAHRTPARMFTYAQTAHSRGLRCIIAGAGGAAHLPGMVAALTSLPVIGVPIPLAYLDGVDSLHSIVQMPRGVPCATVAIGNATNAALLAVRMLAMSDARLTAEMERYMKKQEAEVEAKVARMEQVGWEQYQP